MFKRLLASLRLSGLWIFVVAIIIAALTTFLEEHFLSWLNVRQLLIIMIATVGVIATTAFFVLFKRRQKKEVNDSTTEPSQLSLPTSYNYFDEIKLQLGSRRYRFALGLPWFLVTGTRLSGKSTIVDRAKLKPLAASQTNQANARRWWLNEDCFIIEDVNDQHSAFGDTSKGTDWMSWVLKFARIRSNRPLNGVLVTVSMNDILLTDLDELKEIALGLREKIIKLNEAFKTQIPIYILCNKIDLVAGFSAFFSQMKAPESEQVWGATVPVSTQPDQVLSILNGLLSDLSEPIDQSLLHRLQSEHDVKIREEILRFPYQLTGSIEKLQFVVEQLSHSTPMITLSPWLRGVYFLAAKPQKVQSSYFLKRFFTEFLIGEAGLVECSKKARLRHSINFASLILLTAACCTTIIFLATSYREGLTNALEQMVSRTENAQMMRPFLSSSQVSDTDFLSIIPFIEKLRNLDSDLPQMVILRQSLDPILPDDAVRAKESAYATALQTYLLPRLILSIGKFFNTENDGNKVFDALKFYMMLVGDTPVDHKFAQAQARRMIANIYPNDQYESFRRALLLNIDELINQNLVPIRLPDNVIKTAVGKAQKISVTERALFVLEQLANELLPSNQSIIEINGVDPNTFLTNKSGSENFLTVPTIYTRQGFVEVVRPSVKVAVSIAKSDVAITNFAKVRATDTKQLQSRVYQLYFDKFKRVWNFFLDDLEIRRPDDISQAKIVTQLLADTPSPLHALLKDVAEATDLTSVRTGDDKSNTEDVFVIPPDPFMALRKAVTGNNNGDNSKSSSSPFAELQQLFSELNKELLQVNASSDEVLSVLDGKSKLNEINSAIVGISNRLPPPADRLVGNFIRAVIAQSSDISLAIIRARWIERGRDFCQVVVNDNYPFDINSRQDSSLADFTSLFKPGGTFDSFFQRYMESLVDKSHSPWRWRSTSALLSPPSQALRMFEQADKIRNAFFSSGKDTPTLNILINPLTFSRSTDATIIELAGERVVFVPERRGAKSIVWSSQARANYSRAIFQPAGLDSAIKTVGPWSVFRLLQQAKTSNDTAGSFQVQFSSGRYSAEFQVQIGSSLNPITTSLFDGFRCPADF